jgi:purine catabolism regulator
MRVTIRDVLALPVLVRGLPEVMAGGGELDRPVRWIHAAEVHNIASLLKGGELLLTTGMGFGSDVRNQRTVVAELAARDVAGIVLELGNTFKTPPVALVSACEAAALPLIVLHRPVAFVEVTEAVHAEIINSQFVLMRRGEELHLRWADLLIRGSGVREILDDLADVTRNPVMLCRADDDPILVVEHGHAREDVIAAWVAYRRGLATAVRCEARALPPGDGTQTMVVLAAIDAPVDSFTEVALDRAVGLVGLALQYDGGEHVVVQREHGAFLAQVVWGRLSEADMASQARAIGLGSMPVVAIAVGRRAQRLGRLTNTIDGHWSAVWADIARRFEADRTPAIIGHVGGSTLIAAALRTAGERTDVTERIVALVRAATDRRLGDPDAAVVCAASASPSWERFGDMAEQALNALPAAASLTGRLWRDLASPDIDLLLASLSDLAVMQQFAEVRLDAVIAHDAQRSAKLLPTLAAYCAHLGNKASTARELHLERRSLYHRIKRLETLLGGPLSDPDIFLGVDIALRVRGRGTRPHGRG